MADLLLYSELVNPCAFETKFILFFSKSKTVSPEILDAQTL